MMVRMSFKIRPAVFILACFLLAACGLPKANLQGKNTSGSPEMPITIVPLVDPDATLPPLGSPDRPVQVVVGEPFDLPFAQTVELAGRDLKLMFYGVVADDRCPAGMECVQAGEASFIVTARQDDGDPVSVLLSTLPENGAAVVGKYKIHLQQAEPQRVEKDSRPRNSQYVLTLLVTDISDNSSASLGQPFQLKGGQTAEIPEITLTVHFAEVLEDSRCPKSVNCFWSGQARVALDVSRGAGAPVMLELSTLPGKNSADAFNFHFELQAVEPYPKTTEQKIAFEEYTITLVITTR